MAFKLLLLAIVVQCKFFNNGWADIASGTMDGTISTPWDDIEIVPDEPMPNKDSSDNTIRDYHDEEHYYEYVQLLYEVTLFKSFMQGLGQGFYNDPNVLISEQCLDAEAIRALDNLMEGFRHGSTAVDKLARSMTAFVTLFVGVLNNCRTA
jgi:hypothetical protein